MLDRRPDVSSYARASYLLELEGHLAAARRAMVAADWPAVAAIYAEGIATGNVAEGVFVGAFSLGIGILNAASMTY